jgi:glycosyltransferase involved in cell wall biosynthesis
MVIAVNTRLIVKDKFCGISWFAYESLKRITRDHPEHKFLFFFDRPYNKAYIFSENVIPIVAGPPTRHPFLWHWWFQFSVPHLLRKYKPDLFISPDGFLPLNTSIKTLNVIHDVGFEHYKDNLSFLQRIYYRKYFPEFAKKATRIATVSNFSKDDIAKTYKIPSTKIDVIYDGVNEEFKPLSESQKKTIREKYSNGQAYFIVLGRLHLRKNTNRLLQAFDSFKKYTSSPVKLVIVGNKKWQSKEVKDVYDEMQFQDDVIFTDRISMHKIKDVMGAALALIFIPHYEGFGLAMLEAMQCDIPIVTANANSMPEIAGEAALFVDSLSIDSIKEGMIRIYNEEDLRNRLIKNGRKQREFFSWDKTAENLWGAILKTMNLNTEIEKTGAQKTDIKIDEEK